MKNYDFAIVGAGIIGLTLARSLARKQYGQILILEKEATLGKHASGRNSGVLHSGIYYAADSLKARLCSEGSRQLQAYAQERGIQLNKTGKVIVAQDPESVSVIEQLYMRASQNGVRVEKISAKQLDELEPEARTHEVALFSPDTAIIDSHAVLQNLEAELKDLKVDLLKNAPVTQIDVTNRSVQTTAESFGYGHLINAAGLHADRIAHQMGIGERYQILPFKGIYRKLQRETAARFRRCIYPAPDIEMPFLGAHTTMTVTGDVLVGPTAIPAFGRENYGIVGGMDLKETPAILTQLARMYLGNQNNFRRLVKEEFLKYQASEFLKCIRRIAPRLTENDFLPGAAKVGIRAQLLDRKSMKLVMDFVIEDGPDSTHILNAVSPAFTASMAFAEFVVGRLMSSVQSQ